MKIFCLIAFVFLATSFTTNNENFENISKSETLEVKKPMEEYRINAYRKDNMGNWQKVPIKVDVTNSYGSVNITVLEVYNDMFNKWESANKFVYSVQRPQSGLDSESAIARFEYKAGGLYFNL